MNVFGEHEMKLSNSSLGLKLKDVFYKVLISGLREQLDINEKYLLIHKSTQAPKEGCSDLNNLLNLHAGLIGPNWMDIRTARIFIIVLYSLIGLLGLIFNLALIIYIISKTKTTAWDVFLISMGISDLLLCFTSIPFTPSYSMSDVWTFDIQITCYVIPLCQGLSIIITAGSLCCVTVQRYIQIVLPPNSSHHLNKKGAVGILIALCTFGIILHVPILKSTVYSDQYKDIKLCRNYCGEDWDLVGGQEMKKAYSILAITFQFIIPIIIFVWCNSRILHVIRRDMITGRQLPDDNARNKAMNNKLKATVLLILMVIVFFLCWFSIFIPLTMLDFGHELPWWNFGMASSNFTRLVIYAVAYSSVIWNPLMYFWVSTTQRHAFSSLVVSSLRKKLSGSKAGISNTHVEVPVREDSSLIEHRLPALLLIRETAGYRTRSKSASHAYGVCRLNYKTFRPGLGDVTDHAPHLEYVDHKKIDKGTNSNLVWYPTGRKKRYDGTTLV